MFAQIIFREWRSRQARGGFPANINLSLSLFSQKETRCFKTSGFVVQCDMFAHIILRVNPKANEVLFRHRVGCVERCHARYIALT